MRRPVLVLLALGLLQMTSDVFHLPVLKGVAAATAASPAPKVFSSVRGLETFSSRFFVEWVGHDGELHSLEIRPQRAARIRGPYNRRNVYMVRCWHTGRFSKVTLLCGQCLRP